MNVKTNYYLQFHFLLFLLLLLIVPGVALSAAVAPESKIVEPRFNLKVMVVSPHILIEPEGGETQPNITDKFSLKKIEQAVNGIQKQENFHLPENFNPVFIYQRVDSTFWMNKMDDQDEFIGAFMKQHDVSLLIWHNVEINTQKKIFSVRYSYEYMHENGRLISGVLPGQPIRLAQIAVTDELYKESFYYTFNQVRNIFINQSIERKATR
jgi:hypothetical protein